MKLNLFSKRLPVFWMVCFYAIILAAYIALKVSFTGFYPVKFFRDSTWYATGAERPLTSAQFWVGERGFTLPLLYKLAGVNQQNAREPATMIAVAQLQMAISILSWTALGLTFARRLRHPGLKIAAFGILLAFSLVYDISRWDMILLSESLSFSLLALLLAGWIWLLEYPAGSFKSPRGYFVTAVVIFISGLFAFTRDSNPYFLVLAAVIFTAPALVGKFRLTRFLIVYFVAVILIFVAQYTSVRAANRWQVFIHDHLAYRIIPNQVALDYFVKAGLPVTDQLLQIPNMRGYVYGELLTNDPSMEPVRRWIDAHGMQTYLGYLLSDPLSSLRQPLNNASLLLNGTMEYGDPDHTRLFPEFPASIRWLTTILFPIQRKSIYAFLYLVLFGLAGWAVLRRWNPAAWWVTLAILISMYPMMFITWHGDPMEIERHALQIAILFRLVFWMVLLLAIDHLTQLLFLRLKPMVRNNQPEIAG